MNEKEIKDHLNAALKEKNGLKVSVLRLLISEISNKKIELRQKELEPDMISAIIQKMVKRNKESIEKFRAGGREELAEKETGEMKILEEYLPEPLSKDELSVIIDGILRETGASSAKDMGIVMKAVLEKVSGKADGKEVSALVRERLK